MVKGFCDICIACDENALYCEACDEEDRYYIKETLKSMLNRDIDDSEVCELCTRYEAWKEVICLKCRLCD